MDPLWSIWEFDLVCSLVIFGGWFIQRELSEKLATLPPPLAGPLSFAIPNGHSSHCRNHLQDPIGLVAWRLTAKRRSLRPKRRTGLVKET